MIEFIIHRPVFIAMLLTGLSLLGIISYTQLPVELFPQTDLPLLIVTARSGQVSDPGYVEQHGVIPLEGAIAGLDDIERIESYIDRRQATLFIYYTKASNPKYAYLKLQECVASVRAKVGEEFTFSVMKIDPEQLSNRFLVFQARGEGSLDQIRNVLDEKIVPELENIDGIANVEVYGGRRRSIEVHLDQKAMESYALTASQVAARIAEQSGRRQYLGLASEGRKRYFVNMVSEYSSLPSIEDLVVKDSGPVLLKHIASVVEGGAEQETISRINGQEAVSVTLQRSRESNLISLARQTRKAIASLDKKVKPDGISLAIQTDEARTIEDNINAILWLALAGGLLAIAVLWVFLRNLPLVFIIAVTIPISILISMNLFYALHITINTLTLVGLAIALGMLLDCSIVVLENIFRHLDRQKDVKEAVLKGTAEVTRAIVTATLTTIAIFIPFLFSTNPLVKTLGRQVGAAIIATLLVSLAVAFLLIPVFSYRLLSRRREMRIPSISPGRRPNRPMQVYMVLLKSCLRYPARTLLAAVALFFISIGLCLTLSVDVPQEVELNEFSLYAIMPSGSTLEAADGQVKAMDAALEDIPEIAERLETIQEDNAVLTFKLAEDFEKKRGQSIETIKEAILERLSRNYPLIEFSYDEPRQNVRFRGGSGGGQRTSFTRLLGIGAAQEKVVIQGQNLELLRAIAEDIQYNINNLETVRSSSLNVSDQQPSIDLLLDKAALSHFDVSLQTIRNELSGFQKETSAGVKFKAGNEEIDIILKSTEEQDKKTEDLRRLQVASNAGGAIPILQLGQLVYSTGYTNINRVNQEKQVEVTYRFESDIENSSSLLEEARASVEEIAAGITPPPGVLIEVVHDESDLSEFYFLIIVGVLLIYMILASAFESLLTPLVMMFTLPLAAIGAFLGLILTGNSIYNANVLVGFLILLGVVVNNGIILIDYSRQLQRRKFRAERALLTSGQARVRPILITAITTVLAMLPVALGKAEYVSQIGAPFAITVIGGLSVSTLFTLVLIPTVSFGLGNALAWWRRLGWKIKAVQAGLLAAGAVFIVKSIDSVLWQAAYFLILVMGIPAFTYFLQTSLRRSRASLIPPGTPVTVTVRNITMLYDDHARFTKEWRKGKREQDRRLGLEPFRLKGLIQALIWQIPLYLFLFYFTYFYLRGDVWILVFSVLFYLLTLKFIKFLAGEKLSRPGKPGRKWMSFIFMAAFWAIPLANLIWLRYRWQRWGPAAVIAVLWYAALFIHRTSQKLYGRKINISRISGRFRKIRVFYYGLVKKIPLIGKQKIPFQALDRISLEIRKGMFGLVGPNGAGKTTLMRIICGILPPTRGKIFFNGLDLRKYREELQSMIGYLPQEFGSYENMTALQFLDYQAMLKGIWQRRKREAAVEKALRSVHLFERRNDRIKTYSGGMKQRIGIAQTLLHLPRILVVDEPTAGLDPKERIKFRNLLAELAQDRIVIFSTHIIEDISSSCNRLVVFTKGRVRFVGTPSDLVDLTKGSVWQAFLDGKSFEAVSRTHKVVHHLRDGEKIRARILSAEKPTEEANPVMPTLEDSYMWLLGQKEKADA